MVDVKVVGISFSVCVCVCVHRVRVCMPLPLRLLLTFSAYWDKAQGSESKQEFINIPLFVL